jgi:hypothetical protein
MSELPIEKIRWLDSTSHGGWVELPDDSALDDIEHVSVGMRIRETSRVVVIANSVTAYKTPGAIQKFNDIMAIPKCAILERVEVDC